MKALILGGGIAGLTTAWYLAEAGMEVTVVDRGGQGARCTGDIAGVEGRRRMPRPQRVDVR